MNETPQAIMDDIARAHVNPAGAVRSAPEAAPVVRTEHREGTFARMIEHQTAKIPSDIFLASAIVSMAVSLTTEIWGRQRASRFFGMWVAPLLIMGVYNKLVKTLGVR